MENEILAKESRVSPGAVRSAERALEARFSAYLDEAQRLIRAAIEEIGEQGNVDPRVADIVRRAGLSNKAFYRHFRSKEELLLAVLEEGVQMRIGAFEKQMAEASDATDRLRRWIWCVLEQALDPKIAALTRPLLVHQARLAEALGERVWTYRDRFQDSLKTLLEQAKASGELPDVDPSADAVAIHYLTMGWLNGCVLERRIPTREEAEAIAAFALRGLRRSKEGDVRRPPRSEP